MHGCDDGWSIVIPTRERLAICPTVKAAIAAAIAETGAAGMKDMGKVIGVLKAKYTGQMDFAKASALVKAALNG